jgi:CO/xanthine dehydrogenase Mo-binding subunit
LSSRSRSGSTPSSRAIVSGFFAATYHAHFAEVEVDPDTGRVTVLRYAVGRTWGARSTRMIEGQVHGGVVQGLGYALFENLRVENGVVVDAGLEAYRLPTALGRAADQHRADGNPVPHNPLGAKGAAEPPIVPVAAVTGCAVANAIGTPLTSLPLSPFEVLAALRSTPSR